MSVFSRWGNSLGLRIPKHLREQLGLQEGMMAEMEVDNGKLIIVPFQKKPSPKGSESISIKDLMKKVTPENQPQIDNDDVIGNEIW